MAKYTWKEMEKLHEKLMEFKSYKDNHLRVIPGCDAKTIAVIRRNVNEVAPGICYCKTEFIDEFDTYDELAAFMEGVSFGYWEGVKCND